MDVQARSMRGNLIFDNIEEVEDDETSFEDFVKDNIKSNMGIE